jgi:uncharacterized membrane protein YdbT with pleckstrin-like domain
MKGHLTEGERILYSTKISRKSKIPSYILIFALLAAAPATYIFFPAYSYVSIIILLLGILLFMFSEILLFACRLYVTNHAVSERTGLLSKKMKSLDMDDIINITVTQSVWQRLLRYGEIHISTADLKEEDIIFPCIANPYKAKKAVEENMRGHQHAPARKTAEGLNRPRTRQDMGDYPGSKEKGNK